MSIIKIKSEINTLYNLSEVINYKEKVLPTGKNGKGKKTTFWNRIWCMIKTRTWSQKSALKKANTLLQSLQTLCQEQADQLDDTDKKKADLAIVRIDYALANTETAMQLSRKKTEDIGAKILHKQLSNLHQSLHPDYVYTPEKSALPKRQAYADPNDTPALLTTGHQEEGQQMVHTIQAMYHNRQSPMPELADAEHRCDALAAHIIAPRGLKGTGLEGNFHYNTANAMLGVFQQVLDGKGILVKRQEAAEHFIKLERQRHAFERITAIDTEARESFSAEQVLKSQEESFLEDLKKYGETWIPGGYEGSDGAHATVFRLFEQPDGNYGFSVYNSGDGIRFHNQKQINGQTQYDMAYTYKNIPASSILQYTKKDSSLAEGSRDLICKIIEIANAKKYEGGNFTNREAKDIYQEIDTRLLQMRGEKATEREDFQHYKAGQVAGTCTWHSLMAVTRDQLPRELHQRIKIETQIRCLAALVQNQRGPLSQDRELIIKEGIANIAKTTASNREKGRVSTEEAHQITELLRSYEKKLQSLIAERPKGKDKNVVHSLQTSPKAKNVLPKESFLHPHDQQIQRLRADIYIQSSVCPVVESPNIANIEDLIAHIDTIFEDYIEDGLIDHQSFNRAMREIPFPSPYNQGIWAEEIQEEHVSALITVVNKIARQQNFQRINTLEKKERYIHMCSLYIMAIHAIRKKYPEMHDVRWDFTPFFDPLQTANLTTGDHFLDKRWMQAKEYAEILSGKEPSLLSAFGDPKLRQQKTAGICIPPCSGAKLSLHRAFLEGTFTGKAYKITDQTLESLSEVALLKAMPSKKPGRSQYDLIEKSITQKYERMCQSHQEQLEQWKSQRKDLQLQVEEKLRKYQSVQHLPKVKETYTVYEYDDEYNNYYGGYNNYYGGYYDDHRPRTKKVTKTRWVEDPRLIKARENHHFAKKNLKTHTKNKPQKPSFIQVSLPVRMAAEILYQRTGDPSTSYPHDYTTLLDLTKEMFVNMNRLSTVGTPQKSIGGSSMVLSLDEKYRQSKPPIPVWSEGQNPSLYSSVERFGALVRDSQNCVAISPGVVQEFSVAESDIDLETEQTLRALRADAGTQISNILEYIQLHPEKLEKKSIRQYLLFLLQEPGLLQESILSKPFFLQDVQKICIKGMEQQRQSPDSLEKRVKVICFLQKVWGHVLSTTDAMTKDPEFSNQLEQHAEILDQQWLNWSDNIEKTLLTARGAKKCLSFIHSEAVQWARSLPVEEDLSEASKKRVILFLQAKKFLQESPVHGGLSRTDLECQSLASRAVTRVLQKHEGQILPLASSAYGGQGWTHYSQASDLIVQRKNEQGQRIITNLLTGETSIDGKKVRSIQTNVLQQPEYQLLFGSEPLQQGIVQQKGHLSFYQGTFKGTYYEVQFESASGKIIAIKRRSEFGIEKLLIEAPKNLQYGWKQEDHYFWQGTSRICIIQKKDHQDVALIMYSLYGSRETYKPNKPGEAQCVLLDAEEFIISGKKQARVWQETNTNTLAAIEYANLDLSFSKKGDLVQWDQNPSYHLKETHNHQFLRNFAHYHVVQAGDVEKAIFPIAFYPNAAPEKKGDLPTVGFTDTEPDSTIVVDIVDGKLRPSKRKAALYLAYLALGRRDYEAAREFLSYVHTDSCFSEEQHNIVKRILEEIPTVSGAHHPLLFQLQIQAASLQVQAARRMAFVDVTKFLPEKNLVEAAYKNYLSCQKYTYKEFSIPIQQELDLIEYCDEDFSTQKAQLQKEQQRIKEIANQQVVLTVQEDKLGVGKQKDTCPLYGVWADPTLVEKQEVNPYQMDLTGIAVRQLNEEEHQNLGAYIDKRCEEIQEDTRLGEQQNIEKGEIFRIDAENLIQNNKVEELKNKLLNHQTKARIERDRLEKQVLALANRLEKDEKQSVFTMLSRSRKKASPLLMQDLIKMYIQKDSCAFKERTTLNEEGIEELYNLLTQYFQVSSRFQQLERAITAVHDIDPDKSEQQQIEKARQTLEIVYTKRHFTIKDHPELLVFEHLSGFSLRENQVEIILDMIEGKAGPDSDGFKEVVHQMIMGGGKSKVLLPLLALLRARGDNLSVLMVPKALYETNIKDLREENRQFGQELRTLEFSRKSDTSKEALRTLYEDLQRWKKNKDFIVITDETSHCLDLKYIELHDLLKKSDDPNTKKELLESIQELQKIREMREKEWDVLIDEVHLIASPTKETNYTIGEPEKAKKTDYMAINQIYKLLANVNVQGYSVQDLLVKGTLSKYLAAPGEVEKVQQQIAERIARQNFTIYHDDGNEDTFSLLSIAKQYHEASEDNIEDLVDYLLGKKNINSLATFALVDPKVGKPFARLFGLLRTEISEILGSTLQRTAEENFALSKENRDYLIPLPCSSAGNVIEGAEFSSHFETINYIHQFYRKVPIRKKDVKKFLLGLKEQALSEWEMLGGGVHADNTEIGQQFFQAFHRNITEFDPETEEHLEEFTALLNEKKAVEAQALELFLERMVFPQIDVFTKQLRGTSRNLLSPFRSVQAFTGTPFNWRTYHHRLNTVKNPGTDGQTIDLLRGKQTPVHKVEDESVEGVLTKVLAGKTPDKINALSAFIDVGATFANQGLKNCDVILKIKQYFQDTNQGNNEYFLYFDDNKNKLCYITQDSDEPQFDIENLPKDRSKVFTYYDQQHCTGIDIAQPPNGWAITSVSEKTVQSDLLQGVMRMRGLPKEQEIEIIIADQIATSLIGEDVDIDAIIGLTSTQQIKKEIDQTTSSTITGIQDIARQWAFSVLKEIPLEWDERFAEQLIDDPSKSAKNIFFKIFKKYQYVPSERYFDLVLEAIKDKNSRGRIIELIQKSPELCQQFLKYNPFWIRERVYEKLTPLLVDTISDDLYAQSLAKQSWKSSADFLTKHCEKIKEVVQSLSDELQADPALFQQFLSNLDQLEQKAKEVLPDQVPDKEEGPGGIAFVEKHVAKNTLKHAAQNRQQQLDSFRKNIPQGLQEQPETTWIQDGHDYSVHSHPVSDLLQGCPIAFDHLRVSSNFIYTDKRMQSSLGTNLQKDSFHYILIQKEGGLEALLVTHKEASAMREKLKRQRLQEGAADLTPKFYIFSITGRGIQAGSDEGFAPLAGQEDAILDLQQKALLLTNRYRELLSSSKHHPESWITKQSEENLLLYTKQMEQAALLPERQITSFFCAHVS